MRRFVCMNSRKDGDRIIHDLHVDGTPVITGTSDDLYTYCVANMADEDEYTEPGHGNDVLTGRELQEFNRTGEQPLVLREVTPDDLWDDL